VKVKTDCCSKKEVPVAPTSVSLAEVIDNDGIYRIGNREDVYAITLSRSGIERMTLYFDQMKRTLEPHTRVAWGEQRFFPLKNATLCIHIEE